MSEQERHLPGCIDPAQGSALEAYLERRLDPDQEGDFEDHFSRCPACLEEIRLRQALPAALRETRAGRHGPARWLIAVGAIAAILLVYTSYLGFVELPNVRGRVAALSDNPASMKTTLDELKVYNEESRWTGTVSVVFLTGPARGGQAAPATINIRPGQPFVPLAVVPVLPQAAKPEVRFLFQIRDAGGKTDWELEMNAAEIIRDLEAAKVVTFLIPTRNLPDGRHELMLLGAAGPTSEPVWRTSFQVKTAPAP